MEMAFFDIRVLHPGAKSNANHNTPAKMYNKHEMRERKKGNMETAVYRSKKEPELQWPCILDHWRYGPTGYHVP